MWINKINYAKKTSWQIERESIEKNEKKYVCPDFEQMALIFIFLKNLPII